MQLYELIEIEQADLKVHLAVWNGRDDPLDLYFDGTFKEWQEDQNKRNFQRKYILSLIRYNRDDLWLFAGIYQSHGIDKTENDRHFYKTELTNIAATLRGRLVVEYKRKSRNSYPNGESLKDCASIYEIKVEPLAFSEFTDFKKVLLSRQQLELMFRYEYPSWKSALSSVAGVYLLSNQQSGQHYVGSAYGSDGFWSRWSDYYTNYHGGNSGLKKIYQSDGATAFQQFNYSILETCDIDLSPESVIEIENRWKTKLLTREFGLNEN